MRKQQKGKEEQKWIGEDYSSYSRVESSAVSFIKNKSTKEELKELLELIKERKLKIDCQ